MSYSIEIFNVIASDIGIKRFAGEEEESFCRRVAYSAARFWLLAFCMDDGAAGEKGLTKQAMNRKLKGWISALNRIHPGIEEWFDANGKGVPTIYSRLIDIGDLMPNGFSGSYVATPPSRVALSERLSCVTGFFDPTAENTGASSIDADSLLLSGLTSLVKSENEAILRPDSWWVRDLEYCSWENITDYDEVEFADVRTSRWNIKYSSDAWTDKPFLVDDLTLARVRSDVEPIAFVATKRRGRVRLSKISWIQAQELFFYLRRESGNGAVAKYVMLDNLHARTSLPIGFIPGHVNRILDVIGWPIDDAVDRFNRIVRIETLPLVEELLLTSYIRFERSSNDK